MKLIKQTSRFGCAEAVVAMLGNCTTGEALDRLTYNECRLEAQQAHPFDKCLSNSGYSLPAIAMTLIEVGWMPGIVLVPSIRLTISKQKVVELTADTTLNAAIPVEDSTMLLLDMKCHHVMLFQNGTVYDPSRLVWNFKVDQIIPLTPIEQTEKEKI